MHFIAGRNPLSVSGASVGQTPDEDTHLVRVKDVSGLVGSDWQNYILGHKNLSLIRDFSLSEHR